MCKVNGYRGLYKLKSPILFPGKGLSRNDVTFLGGRGVSPKVTKSDQGEGGISLI